MLLSTGLFNIVAKGVKIGFEDRTSTLVSLTAFLQAQATLILPLQQKNSALLCKPFMHLSDDLINQSEEGREGLVGCSFKSFSIPHDQKKMYTQLELEAAYCAYAKQSHQPGALLLPLQPSLCYGC